MQKALVKKKLIYFTKTIPKFSESEELKKKKKRGKTKTKPKPHTIPSHRRNNRKKNGQINNTTVLSSEYKYY